MAKTDPLGRIEAHLLRIHDKVDDLTTDMATVMERIADYPEVRKDVQGLKRFRTWFVGLFMAGGAGSGIGWFSSAGKAVTNNLPNMPGMN